MCACQDCDHGDYVALVTALCSDKGVYMMKVSRGNSLSRTRDMGSNCHAQRLARA